jgi:hypothetical protein
MSDIFQSRPELAGFPISSKWRVYLGSGSNGVISNQHVPFNEKIGEVVGYNEEVPGVLCLEAIVYPVRLKFEDETMPQQEYSFAPFQLEPIWQKEVREYLAERKAAHERHQVAAPYHRMIESVAEKHSVPVADVQAYFFDEFQKTPEYKVLQHQGEVHG